LGKKADASAWRLWTASSDGVVRSYKVQETSVDAKRDSLDASALSLTCTHLLGDSSSRSFGTTIVSATRNYVGEDDTAGDLVVLSIGLAGQCHVWTFSETWDDNHGESVAEEPKHVRPLHTFTLEQATGTTAALCPPRLMGDANDLVVAIGRLDGTAALVSTGIAKADKATKDPTPAGTVIECVVILEVG
jgi:hypothetical protein